VAQGDFNSYGARRGNHEVMMRGTFANIRIKNAMVKDPSGNPAEAPDTVHYPSGERMAMYDAAMRYQAEGRDLVVFAGKEYGTGSSRDWAAKGTKLLGVRAVIAESFERIHRSNLIGMGVLPLQFLDGESWRGLGLTGAETISIAGVADLAPRQRVSVTISSGRELAVLCRIDTENEVAYFRNGGILHYVLRGLAST
jgi:aconitate hydratase